MTIGKETNCRRFIISWHWKVSWQGQYSDIYGITAILGTSYVQLPKITCFSAFYTLLLTSDFTSV